MYKPHERNKLPSGSRLFRATTRNTLAKRGDHLSEQSPVKLLKSRDIRVAMSAVALCLVVACDTADLQREFLEDAQSAPSGFTQTDQNGGVLTTDEDDWRTAPVFVGRAIVDPAYPNPVSAGLVTVPFRILQFDELSGGVFVRAFDANGRLIPLGEMVETTGPGQYTITINPAQLGTTELHRLFVMDVFGELISYGDLDVR